MTFLRKRLASLKHNFLSEPFESHGFKYKLNFINPCFLVFYALIVLNWDNDSYCSVFTVQFLWQQLMGDEPDLDPEITSEFFQQHVLRFDPALLTESGMMQVFLPF